MSKKLSASERCKQLDIVDFARENGLSVIGKGNDYRLADHNSFVFNRKKQTFYWNSQNIQGDIINLTDLFFIDENITDSKERFKESIKFILKDENKIQKAENIHYETVPYDHHPEDYQPLTNVGRDYLIHQRKLPENLVNVLEKEGLVTEVKPKEHRNKYLVCDDRLDNAVAFLWKGLNSNKVVGASYQGTLVNVERFGERGTYKHIDKKSAVNHGFNWKLGVPLHLKFFESSIDMLSYAALHKTELIDTWLISMEGLKHNVIDHYFGEAVSELAEYNEFPKSINICVDNDEAGHIFYEKVQLMGKMSPTSGKIVKCEREISNDWQLPKEFKEVYNKYASEYNVYPEAIMAVHKAETNLSLKNKIVCTKDMQSVFGKSLRIQEAIQPIGFDKSCMATAQKLSECKKSNQSYDFDKFYKGVGHKDGELLLSIKAEQYFDGYMSGEYEWVNDIKKDWNDQLKHEEQRKIERQNYRKHLFKQSHERSEE